MTDIFTPGAFEDSGGPLYLQLQRLIADAIARGDLQPGDSLNNWQLRTIREDQAVFHVPGHGDRALPIP